MENLEFKKLTIIACNVKNIPDIPEEYKRCFYPENGVLSGDYERQLLNLISSSKNVNTVIVSTSFITGVVLSSLLYANFVKSLGVDVSDVFEDEYLVPINDCAYYIYVDGEFLDIIDKELSCVKCDYLDTVSDKHDSIYEKLLELKKVQSK